MPPQLAALLTYGFILWLFHRDIRENRANPTTTGALWLPILWLFIVMTRNVSQWLAFFGLPGFHSGTEEGGSFLDAGLYLTMIVAGLIVLNHRGVTLQSFVSDNKWLVLFFVYCSLAILWSDFPFVAFKRWIKIIGHPVMVLIVLTEPSPREALRRLIKRCSYIILPISILWIKYLPHLGRKAGEWATQSQNVGIAGNKNLLGNACLFFGLFFIWFFLQTWRAQFSPERKRELRLLALLLFMTGWCLHSAQSATSWLALIAGATIIIGLGFKWVNKARLNFYAVAILLTIVVAEGVFDAGRRINEWRGKQDTIEGRGRLWQVLLDMDTNPVIGVGFESFWLGERHRRILAMPDFQAFRPNSAHNGYLELYLNLGVLGLVMYAAVVLDIFRKSKTEMYSDFLMARFRLGTLFSILLYNWTEAAMRGLSTMYFLFFLIAVRYGKDGTSGGDTTTDEGEATFAETEANRRYLTT